MTEEHATAQVAPEQGGRAAEELAYGLPRIRPISGTCQDDS